MRPRHLLSAALFLGVGACAALRPDPPVERDASYRLDRGLAALQAGEYRAAFDDLAWVFAHCEDRVRGAEALVALSALELDPRNRAARPGLASDLMARTIREPALPGYVRPLAQSAYLQALALGAPPAPAGRAIADGDTAAPLAAAPDSGVRVVRASDVLDPPEDTVVYGCGTRIAPSGWVPPPLPELTGPSFAELLADAERARDLAVARADTLRVELEAVRQSLQETEAELERIRTTLKP